VAATGLAYARAMIGYDEVELLRRGNAAWALLRADHAALVLSFLDRVYVDAKASAIPAATLASELDNELSGCRDPFPRPRGRSP